MIVLWLHDTMYDLVGSCSCHYMNLLKQPKEEVQESFGASKMCVMSRNALQTSLMVPLQAVHTPGFFSKLADWVLRMPRDGLTIPYRLPAL